jgi:hypothetical protein
MAVIFYIDKIISFYIILSYKTKSNDITIGKNNKKRTKDCRIRIFAITQNCGKNKQSQKQCGCQYQDKR